MFPSRSFVLCAVISWGCLHFICVGIQVKISGKDTDAITGIMGLLDQCDDDEDVVQLGVPAAVAIAKGAHEELEAMVTEIAAWKRTMDYLEVRAHVDRKEKAFVESFKILREFQVVLEDTIKTRKKQNKLCERRNIYKDGKKSKEFVDGGAPFSVAMGMYKISEIRGDSIGLVAWPDVRVLSVWPDVSSDTIMCVPMVLQSEGVDDVSKELTRVFDKVLEYGFERAAKIVNTLRVQSKTHGNIGLDKERLQKDEATINMEKFPPSFHGLSVVPIVTAQVNMGYQCSRAADPLMGAGRFLQPLCGYCQVILIPMGSVLAEGVTIHEINQTLETATDPGEPSAKEGSLVPTATKIGMSRGNTLWIPFGMVPLVVFTELPSEELDPWHLADHGAFITWYVTASPGRNVQERVTAEVSTLISSSLSLKPKCIDGWRDDIIAWHAKWSPATNVAAPSESVD